MSKIVIVESKNGSDNIDKSRQATNVSNLNEDRKEWQKIVDGDSKNKIVPTIVSRLEKNYEYYGFKNNNEIDFAAVQRLAKAYLDADPWLQINYCRDSTRQSIDESVQTATLNKFINNTFTNIANGKEVLFNGKIVSKKEANGLNGKQIKARSVDAVGVVADKKVKLFQKYSKQAGSGQSHQTLETQNWLEECFKIKDKSILFVAQLDGGEAESHIPELQQLVSQYTNMFVGNSEQVIDWLNNHAK
jgi:2-succinyl-5-enolpyruvyl-6-hydroxy-3-cyclohexene-1-carboxylate synthase